MVVSIAKLRLYHRIFWSVCEMITIEEVELRKILSERGKLFSRRAFPTESLISLVAFVASAVLSRFFLQVLWIKVLVWVAIALYALRFAWLLLVFFRKKYSAIDLYNEIAASGEKIHEFSLLVITDSSGLHGDKFLLRYDRRWKCWMLPYRATHAEDDARAVSDYVHSLPLKSPKVGVAKEERLTKYSVSAGRMKDYLHRFYPVSFDFSESGKRGRSLRINGEKYRWFSVSEMKEDRSIVKKNLETVEFVSRNFCVF